MFAGPRTSFALPLSLAVALGLPACDVSQKKPETGSTLTTQRVAGVGVRASAAAVSAARASADAGQDRSVRLYGPGISHERQTRI